MPATVRSIPHGPERQRGSGALKTFALRVVAPLLVVLAGLTVTLRIAGLIGPTSSTSVHSPARAASVSIASPPPVTASRLSAPPAPVAKLKVHVAPHKVHPPARPRKKAAATHRSAAPAPARTTAPPPTPASIPVVVPAPAVVQAPRVQAVAAPTPAVAPSPAPMPASQTKPSALSGQPGRQ